jgi:murein DD-endopeptidase MepM/ murein hydrolase activator NlpD
MRRPFDGNYPTGDDYQAHLDRGSKAPGVDFALPMGTPVLAAEAGKVAFAGFTERSGYFVRVAHAIDGEQVHTLYCHLLEAKAKTWQRLDAGQVIGLSGSTGHSTGPHLHFAVGDGLKWVDPQRWLDGDNKEAEGSQGTRGS